MSQSVEEARKRRTEFFFCSSFFGHRGPRHFLLQPMSSSSCRCSSSSSTGCLELKNPGRKTVTLRESVFRDFEQKKKGVRVFYKKKTKKQSLNSKKLKKRSYRVRPIGQRRHSDHAAGDLVRISGQEVLGKKRG